MLITFITGIIAAIIMNTIMVIANRATSNDIHVLDGIGKIFSSDPQLGQKIANVVHIVFGGIFAIIYYTVFYNLGIKEAAQIIPLTLAISVFQALFVAYALVFFIFEGKRSHGFRQTALLSGAVHLLGHLFYGAAVGGAIALSI